MTLEVVKPCLATRHYDNVERFTIKVVVSRGVKIEQLMYASPSCSLLALSRMGSGERNTRAHCAKPNSSLGRSPKLSDFGHASLHDLETCSAHTRLKRPFQKRSDIISPE